MSKQNIVFRFVYFVPGIFQLNLQKLSTMFLFRVVPAVSRYQRGGLCSISDATSGVGRLQTNNGIYFVIVYFYLLSIFY